MSVYQLSRTAIESFCGDIITLQFLGGPDLSQAPIVWESDNPDCVHIRSWEDCPDGFRDGVLLVLMREGRACVSATLDGKSLYCQITVHPLRHASSEEQMQYYCGDMHSHTGFSDGSGTPSEAFERVQKEGVLDFFTVSDHACFFAPRHFFETIRAAEEYSTQNFVAFAAQEADLTLEYTDDYGLTVNNGGELLTYQAEGWAAVQSFADYFDRVGSNPALMIGVPHPSDIGGKDLIIWNGFALPQITEPRFRKHLRFIEIINSPTFEAYNLLHERIFSQALDNGCHVCPIAGSDTHTWNWGEGASWSRTAVMAPERTREALVDAMLNGRVYTTESGNVRLRFQVNGIHLGGIVPAADSYLADFSFDVFQPANETERIVRAELFSDGGEVVSTIELNRIRGNYTLGCCNRKAHYFYLRLTDAAGDRTWSAPIWTDNPPEIPAAPIGEKIPREEIRVLSASPGRFPEKIMNGSPNDGWWSERSNAQIILDLGQTRTICGMGYYHHLVEIKNCMQVAALLAEYRIEASADGNRYELVCHGNMRSYGGEQRIPFPPHRVRFIRFTALSSVGDQRGTPKYKGAPVAIGELAVYESGSPEY